MEAVVSNQPQATPQRPWTILRCRVWACLFGVPLAIIGIYFTFELNAGPLRFAGPTLLTGAAVWVVCGAACFCIAVKRGETAIPFKYRVRGSRRTEGRPTLRFQDGSMTVVSVVRPQTGTAPQQPSAPQNFAAPPPPYPAPYTYDGPYSTQYSTPSSYGAPTPYPDLAYQTGQPTSYPPSPPAYQMTPSYDQPPPYPGIPQGFTYSGT